MNKLWKTVKPSGRKVVKANATYTGGGIYQYTGQLDNGHWFQTWTDWEDYVQELDADPELNWDESGYEDWQTEHTAVTHTKDAAMDITRQAMDWILRKSPVGNYSVSEIKDARADLDDYLAHVRECGRYDNY